MKMPIVGICLLVFVAGCERHLVATPNVLQDQDPQRVFADCPPDRQTPLAAVVYATDRVADKDARYGVGRSSGLAFGVASVSLSSQASWPELARDSTLANRSRDYTLKLADVRTDGEMPSPLGSGDKILQASATTETNKLHGLLRDALAQSGHKDAFIFVHGFNSTFDDSVFRAAEVWHFMGRVGVPIAYSWPAGFGGPRGYPYDRESGEFTVTHLRQFLKSVAACPEVERVHVIAHSRGCDVVMSALRELNLEMAAAGLDTRGTLKLENLVLAAPDVDEEVFLQRFMAENLLQTARRTSIYYSPGDRAIEASEIVFASRRLGSLGSKDFSPLIKERLAQMPTVHFIECNLSGITQMHSYLFTHPAALSDLILLLRDRREPGQANGRPLRPLADGVWELTDAYGARKKQ
ncbi:MAG TPA: alpha/beta hydrolase [Gemmataceae bacterium]|nr:alpha/beta hydrolase [Gemmataceae bacterium]